MYTQIIRDPGLLQRDKWLMGTVRHSSGWWWEKYPQQEAWSQCRFVCHTGIIKNKQSSASWIMTLSDYILQPSHRPLLCFQMEGRYWQGNQFKWEDEPCFKILFGFQHKNCYVYLLTRDRVTTADRLSLPSSKEAFYCFMIKNQINRMEYMLMISSNYFHYYLLR